MAASPFPWLPMLAISIGLVSHSYALSSLFPYVGVMVQHLGVTDNKDEAGQSVSQGIFRLNTKMSPGMFHLMLEQDVVKRHAAQLSRFCTLM